MHAPTLNGSRIDGYMSIYGNRGQQCRLQPWREELVEELVSVSRSIA